MGDTVKAPWTDDQVRSLNAYQESGFMHPFICSEHVDDNLHADYEVLVASRDGWHCPVPGCAWHQVWAWAWMADWSWEEAIRTLHDELAAMREAVRA